MSIEMNNPKTVLEKIDAAANYAAQLKIALMLGNGVHVDKCLNEISRLLHEAMSQIEEEG